jgi:hypothetical protein
MKKFAILIGLALELAVCGCGSSSPSTQVNTTTSGNWEARMTGGTDQASLLNFVTAFSVTNSGPLNITGFGFINSGKCFANGANQETVTGSATLNSASTGAVTGTLSLNVKSVTPAGNSLALTGNLTGTSSGTTGTTGTLSNGIVVGTWTLTGGQGDPSCTGSGAFLMCQGTNTCTPP